MRLLRVGLENFRSFGKRVDFDFTEGGVARKCVLLVGPNGAGKTAILDAIAKFFTGFESRYEGGSFLQSDVRRKANESQVSIAWSEGEVYDVCTKILGGYSTGTDAAPCASVPAPSSAYPGEWLGKVRSSKNAGVIVRFDVFRFLPNLKIDGPTSRDILTDPRHGALAASLDGGVGAGNRFQQIKQWLVNNDFYRVKAKADRGEDWPPWNQLTRAMNTLLEPFHFSRIDDDFRVLFVDKEGIELPIDAMSDGIRSLFVIIGELLQRLSLATDDHAAILEQEAVCLIDEIDAHLHPKWQLRVMPALMKLFPNVQFIATTHSPFVVESVPQAILYKLFEEEL